MTVPTTGMLSSKPDSGAGTTNACCWFALRVTLVVILGLVGVVVPLFEVEAFKGGCARGVR
jgi:hypothetical protein